ncbi:MAG: hypothetical protein ACRD0P_35740, partial [Stackebrandtia sp.]
MVDVTLNSAGGTDVVVKLQTEAWEINIYSSAPELLRLRGIADADWNARRSLAIGTCAGAPVFWAAMEGDQAIVLIGGDDEAWDVGVTV